MDDIDIAMDRLEERQKDIAHEARMYMDADYALEQLGLPEIMHMLEHLSS